MTIRRVLGLGTYPIVKPIHGGQRRVAALREFYKTVGVDYVYACIYDTASYAPPFVGPHDIPLVVSATDLRPESLLSDVLSSHQAETDTATFNHFRQIVDEVRPDMLQLEHPFMWPLASRLAASAPLPIVYSSHNIEAPLKRTILENFGVSPDLSGRVSALIEQMEAQLCDSAALILCVSASDREHYLRRKPSATIVVPNGVDRPPETIADDRSVRAIFGDNRFLFMVGSAYPPNVDGFCECVARDGIFICPPRKTIAVCGGVSHGIFAHSEFQRFAGANENRIQFFPKIDDPELWSIKTACHAVMLPLLSGGGSNLKTAEALALGKWVVTTPTALRGFETFIDAEGVILAKDRHTFRRALARTLRMPPLEISEASRKARDNLYWDALFANSELADRLARL